MGITCDELYTMDKSRIQLIDLRGETEIAHGAVPGAIPVAAQDILTDNRVDKTRRLILICTQGITAGEAADELTKKGYAAEALEGGYRAYLVWRMSHPELEESKAEKVEKSLQKKFHKSIFSKFTHAINEYALLSEGDSVAVCLSGGKDSMLLAKLFQELQKHNKFPFTVKYFAMDPGYSPENRRMLEKNAKELNVPLEIYETDIFDSVFNVEKNPCYLCARMRRGHLYRFAKELGCNKIALGHHYDDVIETVLMGMLYGAQMQGMMPKLHSTNFEGMELIRPMYLIREADICHWRDYNHLTFLQCACKFTENSAKGDNENLSKRKEIKALIANLKTVNPQVEANIFRSMENVQLDTLLGYKTDGVKHSFLERYSRNGGEP